MSKMASRFLTVALRQANHMPKVAMSSHSAATTTCTTPRDPRDILMNVNFRKIGTREVVGYGSNGEPIYFDCIEYPMPAIRYKEVTPEIQALREKEKGDWKKLTIDEKKALYRASFRQTFAEQNAHTGHWKSIVGIVCLGASFGLWIFLWAKLYVHDPIPERLEKDAQLALLERLRTIEYNPITGLGSRYK